MRNNITKTALYNFDPFKPHFYVVKLGFVGVYIIFLISAQNIDCGYSLEPPHNRVFYHKNMPIYFNSLKPEFYIVKLGFTGVYIIFLISAQNIDCGYSLEPPPEAVLTCTHNLCFAQKYEKYQSFYRRIFSCGGDIHVYFKQACFRNDNDKTNTAYETIAARVKKNCNRETTLEQSEEKSTVGLKPLLLLRNLTLIF